MGSLRVGNLSPSVSEDQLRKKFASIGPLARVRLMCDPVTLASWKYGLVSFKKKEDADKALADLNYTLLGDKPMEIRRGEKTFVNQNGLVDVKNLGATETHVEIYQLFVKFGAVHSLKLFVSQEYEMSSRAMLRFELERSAREAVQVMNGVAYKDRILVVSHDGFQQTDSRLSLFVGNLALRVDDGQLAAAFANYAGFKSAKVITDDIGLSKGFGFVQYASEAEANTARVMMNRTRLISSSPQIPLTVRWAKERKNLRQPQVAQNIVSRPKLSEAQITSILPSPVGEFETPRKPRKFTSLETPDDPVEAEQIAKFDLVSHPQLAEFLFVHCGQLGFWQRFSRRIHLVNADGKFLVKTTEKKAAQLQRQVRSHLAGIVKERHSVSQAAYDAVVTEEKRRQIEAKTVTLIRLDPLGAEEFQVGLSVYGRAKNISKAKMELDQLMQMT